MSAGTRKDEGRPALDQALRQSGLEFRIVSREVLPDEAKQVARAIRVRADAAEADLILLTGGTGVAPRDRDPEAVREAIEFEIPGWPRRCRSWRSPATCSPGSSPAWSSLEKRSDINGKKPEFFADKSIHSFTFQGNTFPVKTWEQMLTTLCDHFAATHSQQFEKVLWMYDDHQPCFSRYSDQLRIPEKVRSEHLRGNQAGAPRRLSGVRRAADASSGMGMRSW